MVRGGGAGGEGVPYTYTYDQYTCFSTVNKKGLDFGHENVEVHLCAF